MRFAVVVLVWLVIGAVAGFFDVRGGYWRKGWVIWTLMGPLGIPLVVLRRRAHPPEPVVLRRGRARRGPVDVLVGIDGSEQATEAAVRAVELFGPRLRRFTLAVVVDADTAAPHDDNVLYPDPWPEEQEARDRLDAASSTVRAVHGHDPGAVLLAGEPAKALGDYAAEHDYEVIVVGPRGRGMTKRILGSCAEGLLRTSPVPVLVVPDPPAPAAHEPTDRAAASSPRGQESHPR